MEISEKIVRYDIWCPTCKHYTEKETDDPCNDCLNNPTNTDSYKPIRWEEKGR